MTLSYYGADDRLRGTSTARCQISFDNESSTPPVCAGPAAQNNATAGAEEWYRYDPLGRRILVRTMREHSCTNAQDCTSEVTRYVWDGDQILFEIRAPGGLYAGDLENDRPTGTEFGSVLYTHGPKLDQPLDIIRMGSYLHSPWGDAYPVHPIADWRGNFIDGADWNGKRLPCGSGIPCLINWPTYSAFRGRTPATQTTFFGSLVFGKEDASGFTYMRNRYYNPQTGSFTQPDPIGLAGGLNSYGFAAGDPVTYSDPYGLSAQACPPRCTKLHGVTSGIGAVLGGVGGFVLGGAGGTLVLPGFGTVGGAGAGTVIGAGGGGVLGLSVGNLIEIGVDATQRLSHDLNRCLPWNGPPNGTLVRDDGSGKGQIRDYGPDGRPKTDYDFGHDHTGAGDPHAHDFDHRKPPREAREQPRPVRPNETPPTRQ